MNDKQIFCLGYGYTATHVGDRLRRAGWRIAGTTRQGDNEADLRAAGVEPVIWRAGPIAPHWLEGASALLISTPPDEQGCPALRAARPAITAHSAGLRWIGYLSSNNVYGDHGGALVDEDTAPTPASTRAKRRFAAENAWRAFAKEQGLPLVIFRLPGIYGPGRSTLDAVRAGTAKRIQHPGHVVNRAHVDDIAATLIASMGRPRAHDLYNVADDEPAPSHEVVAHACALLGVSPPPLVALEDAALTARARSFYAECKRVSNARMKQALGVTLQYPTYREGLAAVFAAEE